MECVANTFLVLAILLWGITSLNLVGRGPGNAVVLVTRRYSPSPFDFAITTLGQHEPKAGNVQQRKDSWVFHSPQLHRLPLFLEVFRFLVSSCCGYNCSISHDDICVGATTDKPR